MSRIFLVNGSCADQTVDAVVNAANSGLWAGGGICGVIFKKTGMAALTAACAKYKTPLKDGSAVITPAFQMKNAKHTISFPLVSSGIFGGSLSNPVAESTKQCCRAYKKFTEDYPNYPITVILCAFSANEMVDAQKMFDGIMNT